MVTKILALFVALVIAATGTYVISEGKCPITGKPICGSAESETAPCAACCMKPVCCDEASAGEAEASTTAKAATLGGCVVGMKTCPAAGCCGD
jgi:hypothetical protein